MDEIDSGLAAEPAPLPPAPGKTPNTKRKIALLLLAGIALLGAAGWGLAQVFPRTVRFAPGATALVLRLDETPGYTWGAPALANAVHPGPTWSLYGDGTVILWRDSTWSQGTLPPATVQALLRQVVDSERFFDTDARYIVLPDIGYTTFTLSADGQTQTTRVDGLEVQRPVGLLDQIVNSRSSGPERLRHVAAALARTVPPVLQALRPAHARLYLEKATAHTSAATPWPFPRIALPPPADAPPVEGPRIIALDGDLAAQALDFAPTVRYVVQGDYYAFVIVLPDLP